MQIRSERECRGPPRARSAHVIEDLEHRALDRSEEVAVQPVAPRVSKPAQDFGALSLGLAPCQELGRERALLFGRRELRVVAFALRMRQQRRSLVKLPARLLLARPRLLAALAQAREPRRRARLLRRE